jgi:OmpA-OmpF porin, OOP family
MRFVLLIALSFFFNISVAQIISNESFRSVNTPYDELNPVLSQDGQLLFFTVANHPLNIGGKRDPGDIWFAHWQGDKWSEPTHGGNLINDRAYNAVAGLSFNGNELYLLSHYDPAGNTARTQGISVSRKAGDQWSAPQNIVIPYFQNKSTFLSGTLSQDLKVFIFSAETYGTHGVDDLYMSTNENGKWTEPRNLGNVINTQFQELSPSLSADGKTLYFSSNGRRGSGSFDVYAATRLDESWTAWTSPVNLGSPVNTEGRELFFRDYPALGLSLLTSTKDSDGYGHLRIHRYEEPKIKTDTIFAAVTEIPDTTLYRVEKVEVAEKVNPATVKVHGKVTNSKTGEAVAATLYFAAPSLSDQIAANSDAGVYQLEVPSSDIYSIKIEAPGYVSVLEKLDIKLYEMKELEMNFSLQPLEIGTKVNLKNVLFVQTKTDLLPESYDELDMVVSFLKQNPNVKIELSGHTDNRGVKADNLRLSLERVNSVKRYLVSKGIDPKRITGKGYGGSKPIASNETEESRKMNRRVEFTIKKF